MSKYLTFLAGAKALPIIREKGLRPEMVTAMPGAAGGPKWLVLSQLDRTIFLSWFKERTEPLFLIGSSIGSWRFASLSCNDPAEAIERFQSSYTNQRYPQRPSAQDVTAESSRILDCFLGDSGIKDILNHPYLRLNILSVRSKWLSGSEKKMPLVLGLLGAALSNILSRKLLRFFFERVLFYHPLEPPHFFENSEFPIQKVQLTEKNLKSALLASGSIPLVMSGVEKISGAANGLYWDGGLLDYHLDIPFMEDNNGIVLYPHYTDRIIPGWLDKKLSWRKPDPKNMENVLLVSPSRKFVESLPNQRIPDRNDFFLYERHDDDRIAYWNTVANESGILGQEFLEAVETDAIKRLVQPMPV